QCTCSAILRSFTVLLFYLSFDYHQDLHSFPTRRSSDLAAPPPTDPARWRGPFCTSLRTPAPRPGTPASGSRWPWRRRRRCAPARSEEHTSELQSRRDLVCRFLLEKKK